MKACFHHGIKKIKKVMAFQLTIWTLFFANENKKVWIAIYKFLILTFFSEFRVYVLPIFSFYSGVKKSTFYSGVTAIVIDFFALDSKVFFSSSIKKRELQKVRTGRTQRTTVR